MTVSVKLFSTVDRDESHRHLEEILATGLHPLAECRVDTQQPEPYEVWSGPREPNLEIITDPNDPRAEKIRREAQGLPPVDEATATAIALKVAEILRAKEAPPS